VGVVRAHAERGESTTDLIRLAQRRALERGVTCVHDMVRRSGAPRVYRELDRTGELDLRVRLNYWRDHLDAIDELGLRTNHGSDFVAFGAIKSFSDGAIGGRTAKVSEPFADGEGRGTWVVEPDTLQALVDRADDAGHQLTIHAIGDEAIGTVLELLASTDDPRGSRHRIEHVELPTEDHIERFADVGIIASMQPNFLKWADEDGLYDSRLGEVRSRASNPLRSLVDAGVSVAFGSDGMPVGPFIGIHWAVNARDPRQRLSVDEAIEAYTLGGAYAGFDEDRLGSIEPGKCADLVILERSPWDHPDAIDEIEVWRTIVDGEVVYAAE
ncbi:MAG: amidohydrolase, partial [Halobacteriota archaeon]